MSSDALFVLPVMIVDEQQGQVGFITRRRRWTTVGNHGSKAWST